LAGPDGEAEDRSPSESRQKPAVELGRQFETLSAEELLDRILDLAKVLLADVERQHKATFGQLAGVQTWGPMVAIVGCDPQTGLRQVLSQAWETFELLVVGLERRMSSSAIGLVRFLLEAAALARWLAEPQDPEKRQARAYGLCLHALRRNIRAGNTFEKALERNSAGRPDIQRILDEVKKVRDQMGNPLAEEEAEFVAQLKAIGVVPEMLPSRIDLLTLYSKSGYDRFMSYSEVGSHPGPNFWPWLYQSRGDWARVSLRRVEVERAYWLAEGFVLFLEVCLRTAKVGGWESSLDEIADGLGPESLELLSEARARWPQRFISSAERE